MDPKSRRQWELDSAGDDIRKFDDLRKFIIKRARALEASEKNKLHSPRSEKQFQTSSHKQQTVQSYNATSVHCPICSYQHRVFQCDRFKKMSLTERRNLAYSSKLCFNCLGDGHMTRDCSSKSTCEKCQKKHNTPLHPEMVDTRKTVPINQNTALHQSTSQFDTVVLPTAIIPVIASDCSILKCRALLDSGAQLSMMTEDCAQRLQLKRTPASMRLNGIVSSQNISSIVIFKIQTPCVPTFEVKALVRPNLSQFLPTHSFKVKGCFQSRSINLADPEFMESRQIDLILGSDVYEHVVLDGKLQEDNGLHLRNTIFGWVVSGKIFEQTNQVHTVTVLKTFLGAGGSSAASKNDRRNSMRAALHRYDKTS